MLIEIIRAAVLGATPVAAFTFLLLQWSVAAGKLAPFSDGKSLEKQYKDQKKARQAEKKAAKAAKQEGHDTKEKSRRPLFDKNTRDDFFHNKAMFFGGGFYGTMALFTYVIIEIDEIWQFLGVVFTPGAWFENLGFDLIINFFINSVMNIVSAFIWFKTLADYVRIGNGWIWLGAAYLGYMAGVRLVAHAGDEIWAWLLDKRSQGAGKLGAILTRMSEKQ